MTEIEINKSVDSFIKRLKRGESVKTIITYCGNRVMQWVQPNKEKDGYCRYMLPCNGDKSQAVMHNYYLTEDDVRRLYTRDLREKHGLDEQKSLSIVII